MTHLHISVLSLEFSDGFNPFSDHWEVSTDVTVAVMNANLVPLVMPEITGVEFQGTRDSSKCNQLLRQ